MWGHLGGRWILGDLAAWLEHAYRYRDDDEVLRTLPSCCLRKVFSSWTSGEDLSMYANNGYASECTASPPCEMRVNFSPPPYLPHKKDNVGLESSFCSCLLDAHCTCCRSPLSLQDFVRPRGLMLWLSGHRQGVKGFETHQVSYLVPASACCSKTMPGKEKESRRAPCRWSSRFPVREAGASHALALEAAALAICAASDSVSVLCIPPPRIQSLLFEVLWKTQFWTRSFGSFSLSSSAFLTFGPIALFSTSLRNSGQPNISTDHNNIQHSYLV